MSSQVAYDQTHTLRVIYSRAEAEPALRAGAQLRDEDRHVWEIVDGGLGHQSPTAIRPRIVDFSHPHWSEETVGPFEVLREPTTPQPAVVPPPVTLLDWQRAVHANARAKGFYDSAEVSVERISMQLMLIVSEVSEACEDLRVHGAGPATFKPNTRPDSGKPIGFGSELADVAIRVLDLAEFLGIDLEHEIKVKHSYNTTRPRMHGGKKF